jgi:hypothetical protein
MATLNSIDMVIVEFNTLEQMKMFAEADITASGDSTSTWVFDKAVEALSCFPIYYVKLLKHPIPWDGHDPITRSRQMAQIRRERVGWCIENIQCEEEKQSFFFASVYGRFFFREYGDALLFYLTHS